MHTFHTFIQQGGVFTISHYVRHGPGKAESWRPLFDVPTRGDAVAAVNMLNGGPQAGFTIVREYVMLTPEPLVTRHQR